MKYNVTPLFVVYITVGITLFGADVFIPDPNFHTYCLARFD
jgi:hypothetical protein